jgi:HAMP domain-containing protein
VAVSRVAGSTAHGRSGSSAPAGKRLASTVRLPWLIGLAALLALATVTGLLAGRDTSQAGVQRAALDAQEALATGVAQQVRRSLNEGVDDLVQAAQALEGDLDDRRALEQHAETVLRATVAAHGRYLTVALVDARTGRSVLGAPGQSPPDPLGELPDDSTVVAVLDDGRIVESAPVGKRSGLVVAAVYDPTFLLPVLRPAPESVSVVDGDQRALTSTTGVAPGSPLEDEDLRRAAQRGEQLSGTLARRVDDVTSTVIAYAPVTGVGVAGDAGLAVVLSQVVLVPGAIASYRVPGVLASLLLGLTAVAVFRWLHVAVVRPVLQLQRTAERVAYGDLSQRVVVDRYDEVGGIARSLERLRLALIRAKVQDLEAGRSGAEEKS